MTTSIALWRTFSAAPHRMFFWTGALYAVVSAGLWSYQQTSLYTPLTAPQFWQLPYVQAHAFMMTYGLFGFYFFGFLLTTFPRWLDAEPVPRARYMGAWLCLAAGALAFWVGLFAAREVSVVGVVLMLLAYAVTAWTCARIVVRAGNPRPMQQVLITAGIGMGVVGLAAAAVAFQTGNADAYRASRWIGLYGFVLVVVFTVIYRMVPFFTSTVTPDYQLRRSTAALPAFTAALLGHGVLGYLRADGWLWVPDAVLLVALLRELVVWRFWRAKGPPLLLILYIGLAWFVLSFGLTIGESLYVLLSGASAMPFRNAALHALTVGGLGSLLLGISTRVTLGHSGRGLITNRAIHALFYGFQIVPVLRIAPDIAGFWMPALALQGFWSGWLWVAAFGVWFLGVGPILLRPRSDGRSG